MDLVQPVKPAAEVKIMINIGAGLDIPTGHYIKGRYGEYILNGGLSPLTGVVGIGNNFKSTFLHFQSTTALGRMSSVNYKTKEYYKPLANTYDTEVNIHEWHLKEMIANNISLNGEDIIETGRWVITDKTVYTGEDWWRSMRDFSEDKIKNAAKLAVRTPFWSRNKAGVFMMPLPTFTEVDSFSEFETSDVTAMQDKNDLGESGGNTIHMRQGLAKLRILMEAPRLSVAGYNYILMTAHLGKETTMQNAGPAGSVPIVKLKSLKNGDKIKGTTDKFTFVTHNCWHAYNTAPMINQGTKTTEYPMNSSDDTNMDTDLNLVSIRNLRGKAGITGMSQILVVSQSKGVLPTLTEFHTIKENGRFGISGSAISYAMDLLPEVNISRTTVRNKIDNNDKLRRAINITSEMYQIDEFWNGGAAEYMCHPKQLYQELKEAGYDWNILLDTRGWWTIDNEFQEVQFLSTYDLLRMRVGLYVPYWFTKEQVDGIKNLTQEAIAVWQQAQLLLAEARLGLK